MPRYTYDHINLRTAGPAASAEYYKTMFGAEVIESVQSDGQSRIDFDINGLTIFLARVPEGADAPTSGIVAA